MKNEVEVRELRYFVAVAEELNFGRAARRLGMAQPPLSKAIRRLESKLGVRLLERTTRQVALTAAGRTLLEEGRLALDALAAAARRARRAGQPAARLVVAVKPGEAELLRPILPAYRATGPGVPPAEVLVGSWGEPAALLRDGRADVGLLRSPFDGRGLDHEPLLTEPRLVALPAEHRLARRRRLRLADLAGEPVPRWPGADQASAAYWAGRDRAGPAAAAPGLQAGPVVGDIAQLLEVVALGQAVAFLPASLADRHARDDLVYRPVADLTPSTVVVAWPETSRSLAVAAFVRAATGIAARLPQRLTALP
jgi:DNA-binding transcriptional LysR family regulator